MWIFVSFVIVGSIILTHWGVRTCRSACAHLPADAFHRHLFKVNWMGSMHMYVIAFRIGFIYAFPFPTILRRRQSTIHHCRIPFLLCTYYYFVSVEKNEHFIFQLFQSICRLSAQIFWNCFNNNNNNNENPCFSYRTVVAKRHFIYWLHRHQWKLSIVVSRHAHTHTSEYEYILYFIQLLNVFIVWRQQYFSRDNANVHTATIEAKWSEHNMYSYTNSHGLGV